ncbi:MAG: efflux RND transporter periplasmic adaptor subunit [Aquificaceae bacterium]|nr:efflux RND transporter periplasmic adaptor subunit [Aquificaceae bacterium]
MKNLAILLIFALVISCGQKEKKQEETPKQISVSVHKLKPKSVEIFFETKGFFESDKDVILKPEISGKVINLLVQEGQAVKRGQALIKLDGVDFQNRLNQLNAELMRIKAQKENLEAIAKRRQMLFEKELIAREELENALTQVKVQQELENSIKAQIETTKVDLSRTLVKAPFDGYVAKRFVSVGDYVSPQSQLLRVVNLKPLNFVFQAPQELLSVISQGSEVKVISEPFGEFSGKVFFISPAADQNRLITIKARFENKDEKLKPGMFGQVKVSVGSEDAFELPERAIVIRGTKKIVWRIENGVANLVEVQVIKKEGSLVYVQGPLKEGDLIALENAYLLQQGMKVVLR